MVVEIHLLGHETSIGTLRFVATAPLLHTPPAEEMLNATFAA